METQAIPLGLWDDNYSGSSSHPPRPEPGARDPIALSGDEEADEEEDRGPPVAVLKCLLALEDGARSEDLVLSLYNGDNLVGRSSKCDVVIDDCTVSDTHAELVIGTDSEVNVKDLKSSNGTFVEAWPPGSDNFTKLKRSQTVMLYSGCRVRFGAVECTLELINLSTETQAFESTYMDENIPADVEASEFKVPSKIAGGRAEEESDSEATDPGLSNANIMTSPSRPVEASISTVNMTPCPPSTMDTVIVDDDGEASVRSGYNDFEDEVSSRSLSEHDIEVDVITQTPHGSIRPSGESQEVVVAIAPTILGMFEEVENELAADQASQPPPHEQVDVPAMEFFTAPEEVTSPIVPSTLTADSLETAEQRMDTDGSYPNLNEAMHTSDSNIAFSADLNGIISSISPRTASTAEQSPPGEERLGSLLGPVGANSLQTADGPDESPRTVASEHENAVEQEEDKEEAVSIPMSTTNHEEPESSAMPESSGATAAVEVVVNDTTSILDVPSSTAELNNNNSEPLVVDQATGVEVEVSSSSVIVTVINEEAATGSVAAAKTRGGRSTRAVKSSKDIEHSAVVPVSVASGVLAKPSAGKESPAKTADVAKEAAPSRATRGKRKSPEVEAEEAKVEISSSNEAEEEKVATSKEPPKSRSRARGGGNKEVSASNEPVPAVTEPTPTVIEPVESEATSSRRPDRRKAPVIESNSIAEAPTTAVITAPSSRSKRKEPEPSEPIAEEVPSGRPSRRLKSEAGVEASSAAFMSASIEAAPQVCNVLFSGIEPLPALVKKVGAVVVDDPSIATHVITMDDTIKRTVKLMTCLNKGVSFVVSEKWLHDSAKVGKPIPITSLASSPYIVRDPAKEQQWGFKLSDTLALPRGSRPGSQGRLVFAGLLFYFTPAVFKSDRVPPQADMRAVVESGGGAWLESLPVPSSSSSSSSSTKKRGSAATAAPAPDLSSLVVIVLPPALREAVPAAKRSKGSSSSSGLLSDEELTCLSQSTVGKDSRGRSRVFYPELLLLACLRQRIDFDENSELV